MPAELSRDLEFLIEELETLRKPGQLNSKTLCRFFQSLHERQASFESLLSDYPAASRLSWLRKLITDVVERLAQTSELNAVPSAPRKAEGQDVPLRLADLGLDELHAICLGLSTCCGRHASHPFPATWRNNPASPFNGLLAALCERLHALQFPDGASDYGTVLNVQNLFSRALKAQLLSPSEPVRKHCAAFLRLAGIWANQRKADVLDAHQLGKFAMQIDALLRFGLFSASDRKLVGAIMEWLTSKAAMTLLRQTENIVTLSNFCTLLKTLLKHGMLAPTEERNDPVFLALARLIGSISPDRFLQPDTRALAACAVLLRSCILNGQSRRWAAKSEFSGACDKVIATVCAPEFQKCSVDSHSASMLAEFLQVLEKEDWTQAAPPEAKIVGQRDYRLAARQLLGHLSTKSLSSLRSSRTIEGLMSALGWMIVCKRVSATDVGGHIVALVNAISHTGLADWNADSAQRVSKLLSRWRRQGVLTEQVWIRGTVMLTQRSVERSGTEMASAVNNEGQLITELLLSDIAETQGSRPRFGDQNWVPVGGNLASAPALKSGEHGAAKRVAVKDASSPAPNRLPARDEWRQITGASRSVPEVDEWKPIEVQAEEDTEKEVEQPDASRSTSKSAKPGNGKHRKPGTKARSKDSANDAFADAAKASESRVTPPAKLPGNYASARQLWFQRLRDKTRDPMQILPHLAKAFPALLTEREPKSQQDAMALALKYEQAEAAIWLARTSMRASDFQLIQTFDRYLMSLPRTFRMEGAIRRAIRGVLADMNDMPDDIRNARIRIYEEEMSVLGMRELLQESGLRRKPESSASSETEEEDVWELLRRSLERAFRFQHADFVLNVLRTPVGAKLVSMPWPYGASPLHYVLSLPDTRMLRMLLAIRGVPAMAVRADATGLTPLKVAIFAGSRESLRCLLALPEVQSRITADMSDENSNPLLLAIHNNRVDAVVEMLELPPVRDFVLNNDLMLFGLCIARDLNPIIDHLAGFVKHYRNLTLEQVGERLTLAMKRLISSYAEGADTDKG